MKKYYVLYIILLLFCIPKLVYSQVTFTTVPQNKQLYSRNVSTNQANIVFAGSVNGIAYNAMQIKVYKNNDYYCQEDFSVSYTNNKTNFSCRISLNAELSLYKLELYGVLVNGSTTLLKTVSDILVGDAYLICGQSNAYASPVRGYTSSLRSPYIVSFGRRAYYNDMNWYQANGDRESGFIGQWGLKMARQIVDNYQIPIAILNEADPGTPISNFMRDDSNHYNVVTNYGRLLNRAKNAGIQNSIRGIFYYQGEWDGDNAIGHKTGYTRLYNNWKENYPSIEKFYVMQVREGCGRPSVELRNYQRLLQDELQNLTTITSNGLTGHDGCHFYYDKGYETLGENVYRIVAMQLYGAPENLDYYSINVENVTMNTPNQITITTRNDNEVLVWNSGAENDFIIDNNNIDISSGTVNGNKIILTLSTSIEDYSEINTLSYKGHSGTATNWIYNTEGSSLLSFYQIPINHTFQASRKDLGAGYALKFDGSNDYVETNLSIGSQSYTKEAWIKLDRRENTNNIISGMSYHAFWAPNGRLAAGHNGAWNTVRDPETLLEDIWYHVAVTYNSITRVMKLYKNGILVSQASNVSPAYTDNFTLLGAYSRGYVFRGTMDEVKIWNTERTQEEIRSMMCSKNTNITDNSLLAYYRFDQVRSGTLVDLKGSYNGILKRFNISTAWVVSGAAVGNRSQYKYTNNYSVNIRGLDGNMLQVDNVKGTPQGIHIYIIDEKTYATYPNEGSNIADNLYGIFICNPTTNNTTYEVIMDYSSNLIYNSVLYKESGNDLEWKVKLNQSINAANSTVDLVNQNIYLQELTFASLDETVAPTSLGKDLGAGYALKFDGSNDYVETNLSIGSQSYTKEAWIKLDRRENTNNIISGMSYHAFWAPNGRLAAGHNGAWNTVRDPETLLEDIWYHVAVTYNSITRVMKLYKNGILVSQASNVSPAYTDNFTLLGAYSRGYVFRGTMDEVKIWNTERTQEEIRSMMCSKNTNITDNSLLAYYRFDQIESSTLLDLKGNYSGDLKKFNIENSWVISGAAIGDSSQYNYNSDYAVSIGSNDGYNFGIDNVSGIPFGIQVYRTNNKTYATYSNEEFSVADNLYGVFICNPKINTSSYRISMTYLSSSNKILNKLGGSDLVWKFSADQVYNTATKTIQLEGQNLYMQELALLASIETSNNITTNKTASIFSEKFNSGLELKVYPIPSTGVLFVNYGISSKLLPILVYNDYGQLVYRTKTTGNQVDEINLEFLPKGIYTIKVGKEITKIILN